MRHHIDTIIYGPLRSGTTMFRLMLKNHPQISNAGEFDYLFDAANVTGGFSFDREVAFHDHGFHNFGFKVDASLDDEALFDALLAQVVALKPGIQTFNLHRHLDKALKLLPGVRVIKLHRDPRDVARSSLPMGFAGTLYHGVQHWIDTERNWDAVKPLLAPENRLELRFEDLVSDPEAELARVCAFMGVDYDPAMLDYEESSTYERPDARVAFKWKRTMSLADVALCTCQAPELIRSRGYDVPEGLHAPTSLGKLRLEFADKLGRWQFAVRRFGVGLTIAEKSTRWLGLRAQHNRIRDKQNVITERYLK